MVVLLCLSLTNCRLCSDAIFNFVRPHLSLRQKLPQPIKGRKWEGRTPAMAAGLTDHIWTLDELLSYRLPPVEAK